MDKIKFSVKNSVTKQDLINAIKLDNVSYNECDTTSLSTCLNWLKQNNKIYTIIKANGKLIGYINFMPLSPTCYKKYVLGQVQENNIENGDILKYTKNNTYDCLLCSIVIEKKFQNGEAIKKLWQGFIRKIKALKKQNIKINNIICDCVSADGIKFCTNNLNGQFILKHGDRQIYIGKLKL